MENQAVATAPAPVQVPARRQYKEKTGQGYMWDTQPVLRRVFSDIAKRDKLEAQRRKQAREAAKK